MMNVSSPSGQPGAMRESSGSKTPAMNATGHLSTCLQRVCEAVDFPLLTQPIHQKKIWDLSKPVNSSIKVIEQPSRKQRSSLPYGGVQLDE